MCHCVGTTKLLQPLSAVNLSLSLDRAASDCQTTIARTLCARKHYISCFPERGKHSVPIDRRPAEESNAETDEGKAIGDILKVAHEAVFFSPCKVVRPPKSRLHLIT